MYGYAYFRYQKSQLDWKDRSEKLEEELLFIKQQLLLKNLPSGDRGESPDQEYAQYLGMICNVTFKALDTFKSILRG